MLEILNVFAADYQLEEDPSLPDGEHSYDFVREGDTRLSPSVEITVIPKSGVAWHGRFFGNYDGPNVVVNGPPNALVVVAAGVAYVVSVHSPADHRILPIWPVRFIRCEPLRGLVVLASFTDVVALGKGGVVVWEAKDLVSDGFTDVRQEASTLVVKGYVAAEEREVETTLDLASGVVLNRM